MKILLFNVSLRPESKVAIFPIGLAYKATAIKKAGFDLEIYDMDALRPSWEQVEEKIKNTEFDVAAMGCIVTGYKHIKKLCELIRKHKQTQIIVGNSVASSIPNILMEKTKADIGVIGEGDVTIIELLKAIENKRPLESVKGIFFKKDGKILFTERREPVQNIDEFPILNYDLFDMEFYFQKGKNLVTEPYPMEFNKIRVAPINTARGCLFNCSFCYHVFKENKFRFRSIESIGKEIKYLQEKYGVNYLFFSDELSFFSKERVNELADYLLNNDIKIFFEADCRAGLFQDTKEDLELIKKLKAAGCRNLGYSLESGDEEILKSMNKHIKISDFVEQSHVLRKGGITPVTSIVIGYPQETRETINKTFDICEKAKVYPSTGYLLPQPGTPMYRYAIEMGLIKDDEEFLMKMGDRQDFTINFTKMSQEEMENLVQERLGKLSEKLGLNLDKDRLIKTGHYVQKGANKDGGPEADMKEIFEGKNVFISGGTGYLGRALVREILKSNPKSIRVFSRDEVKHHVFQEMFGYNEKLRNFVGDVRDCERLVKAIKGADIVIHAAALKRIDMIEYNVEEAIKTNIMGSLNIVKASLENNVPKVVFISTDKACHPVNTYGACKFVSERIFTESNYSKGSAETVFTCVRYGNVLESTGSVIPFFTDKIKKGEDIPLTDERMTRFIITPEQAVKLICNAIKYSVGGEVFIPKLPSMRVVDLINILKEKHNANNSVKVTGIRPGEKIHEIMINEAEIPRAYEFEDMYIIDSCIEKFKPLKEGKVYKKEKIALNNEMKEYSSEDTVVPIEELKKILEPLLK